MCISINEVFPRTYMHLLRILLNSDEFNDKITKNTNI